MQFGSIGFFKVSLFNRSSLSRWSVRSRASRTKCFGYPLRMKCVVSINAFRRKSSSLEHRPLILTNCEYGIGAVGVQKNREDSCGYRWVYSINWYSPCHLCR